MRECYNERPDPKGGSMKAGLALTLSLLMMCAGFSQSTTSEEYIEEARQCGEAGDLERAVEVMRKAVADYPEDPDVHAFLGLYLGQSAGESEDFRMQAARAFESFEVLDRAVLLDSLSIYARFHRGLMGVRVPEFLGKRGQGIADLKMVVAIRAEGPGKVSDEILVSTYSLLAEVHEERAEMDDAMEAWKRIVEIAPESKIAERAKRAIARLSFPETGEEGDDTRVGPATETEDKSQNVDEMVEAGRDYLSSGDYEESEEILTRALKIDSSNAELYVLLATAVGMRAGLGYDEEIADDTDLRIDLCFEAVEYLDRAVELAPENSEIRFLRGVMGVAFPFFVGRLDQAVADLKEVLQNSGVDSLEAQALYHLGLAHRKKALTQWVKVVTEYPESEAAQLVFSAMRPEIRRIDLSEYDSSIVVVDFVLGFQEELPPQTAVWIEDEAGHFIRTLYVSGFAGNVGMKQVTLPRWGAASSFETDATTAASIDVGHHTYVWDLKDSSGRHVAEGTYTIRVEVSYWPSMQYQFVSATIEVKGDKKADVSIEEGDLIPYLEVKYRPREK
jgi:tetratricopeptide (TPR) repeat protein